MYSVDRRIAASPADSPFQGPDLTGLREGLDCKSSLSGGPFWTPERRFGQWRPEILQPRLLPSQENKGTSGAARAVFTAPSACRQRCLALQRLSLQVTRTPGTQARSSLRHDFCTRPRASSEVSLGWVGGERLAHPGLRKHPDTLSSRPAEVTFQVFHFPFLFQIW